MLIDDLLDGILRACEAAPETVRADIGGMIEDFRERSPVTEVRTALRYSTTALDGEIALMIDAARDDLRRVGVNETQLTGPLARMAIATYARAQQTDDPETREALENSYGAMADALRKAVGE